MRSEIKQAIEIFKQNGILWPELKSPAVFISKIRKQLLAQQEGNLLDVEDVVNQLLYYVCVNGRYASLGKSIKNILVDKGLFKTEDSPKFQVLLGESNDDDLQGSETVVNDMTSVNSRDMGPGSDAHIASIDIENTMGQDYRDVFECMLAGERENEIGHLLGLSRDQVKRRKAKIVEFLDKRDYTLAPVNSRLGTNSYRAEMTYDFKSNETTKRAVSKMDLPDVDHRSTSYVDRPSPDLYNPIHPAGDEISNDGLGYEMNLGIEHLHLYV